MNASTTLYRFRIDLSDVDRGVYENLDFRLAMHPSESAPYLLTRVLAFCLNAGDGLEFSAGGLNDPDGPSLSRPGVNGGVALWIEIGNASYRKLHKASKAAEQVRVYTYKDPALLVREVTGQNVHRAERIEIFSFPLRFLDALMAGLGREVRWQVLHNEGLLTVSSGGESWETEIGVSSFSK